MKRALGYWIRKGPAIATAAVALLVSVGCTVPMQKPRLAVVLVVDMLPAEHFDGYRAHFGQDGFNRLIRDGAWLTNANYAHAATVTGPGHATIVTGAAPSAHGIVDNEWYHRENNQMIGCTDDPGSRILGSSTAPTMTGAGPKLLLAPAIADEFKRQFGTGAKAWSVAIKDRAAILMGGQHPDGVLWWTSQTGDFISSAYYFDALPAWCKELNESRYVDTYFKKDWERALSQASYSHCDVDDADYENGPKLFWPNTLPKNLANPMPAPSSLYYSRFQTSPYGNELTFEAARRAVTQENLGADDTPDLLMISLSSPDLCGHIFGPDSHEMLDMMVRTDQQIGEWLAFLDRQVGPDRYMVALTGDHGAGTTPEVAKQQGHEIGRITVQKLYDALNGALREKFGKPDDGIYYVTAVDLPWAYLNEKILREKNIDVKQAEQIVAEAARGFPGVEAALVTADVAQRPTVSLTPLERAVALSTYPGRTAHVFIQMKPNWYLAAVCAGHGTFHSCDTHVPVILMGSAFRKGAYNNAVDMRDLTPTLSAALGMDPPAGASGSAFRKCLR